MQKIDFKYLLYLKLKYKLIRSNFQLIIIIMMKPQSIKIKGDLYKGRKGCKMYIS